MCALKFEQTSQFVAGNRQIAIVTRVYRAILVKRFTVAKLFILNYLKLKWCISLCELSHLKLALWHIFEYTGHEEKICEHDKRSPDCRELNLLEMSNLIF